MYDKKYTAKFEKVFNTTWINKSYPGMGNTYITNMLFEYLRAEGKPDSVSYTHLTLPTNREV